MAVLNDSCSNGKAWAGVTYTRAKAGPPHAQNMTRVGFEPTPPKRLRPERSALDHSATSPVGSKYGQHSPGRPTGRLGATAQLCAPRTLCCEAFELLRFRPGPVQPSSGPKSTRPAPGLQWAHQSNLGRTSAQRCPALWSGETNPFCITAVPPQGKSIRAAPTRSGQLHDQVKHQAKVGEVLGKYKR